MSDQKHARTEEYDAHSVLIMQTINLACIEIGYGHCAANGVWGICVQPRSTETGERGTEHFMCAEDALVLAARFKFQAVSNNLVGNRECAEYLEDVSNNITQTTIEMMHVKGPKISGVNLAGIDTMGRA